MVPSRGRIPAVVRTATKLSPGFKSEDWGGRNGSVSGRGGGARPASSGTVLRFASDSRCCSHSSATLKPEIRHLRSLGREAFSAPGLSSLRSQNPERSGDTISRVEWSLHPNQHGPGSCCHNYRFRFKISASPSANRNRSTRHCSEGFPRLFLSLFLPLLQTNYLAVIDSSGGDNFGCSTLREIFRTLTQSTHVGPKRTPLEACWLPHSHKLLGPAGLAGKQAVCLHLLCP